MSAILDQSPPGMGFMHADPLSDIRKEIGGRLRTLIGASGKNFSDVSKESNIPAADLSAITRGNIQVTGSQLEVLLPIISADRELFLFRLSSEAASLIDSIFPDPSCAAQGPAAEDAEKLLDDLASLTQIEATGAPASAKAREVPAQRNSKARARRSGDKQTKDTDRQPRWGEPTFQGELTFYSFEQCLGPEFKRTDTSKQEISFGYSSPCQIEVRVWTTLDSSTGRARPLGSDAIRVVLFDRAARRKIEEWSATLKRVGECMDRLEAVVGHAMLRSKKRPYCLKCGSPMRICGKPDAQFWGCPNYYSPSRCTGAHNLSLSGQQQHSTFSAEQEKQSGPDNQEEPSLLAPDPPLPLTHPSP